MAKLVKGGQGMNPLYIILGIVIFILIAYVIYIKTYSSVNYLSGQINLNADKAPDAILATKLTNPSSTRYSYGIWIYVNSWNNTNNKTIFSRYSDMVLYLDTTNAILYCTISPPAPGGTETVITDGGATAVTTNNAPIVVTNNFPLQKWVFITVVIDNQTVDMYLDGKMVKSLNIKQVQPNSTSSIYYGSKVDAVINNFQRWSYPLDPQSVYNYYMSGASSISSGGMTGGYHATVTISQNDNPTSTYKLF